VSNYKSFLGDQYFFEGSKFLKYVEVDDNDGDYVKTMIFSGIKGKQNG
jgi:hypothetical protein